MTPPVGPALPSGLRRRGMRHPTVRRHRAARRCTKSSVLRPSQYGGGVTLPVGPALPSGLRRRGMRHPTVASASSGSALHKVVRSMAVAVRRGCDTARRARPPERPSASRRARPGGFEAPPASSGSALHEVVRSMAVTVRRRCDTPAPAWPPGPAVPRTRGPPDQARPAAVASRPTVAGGAGVAASACRGDAPPGGAGRGRTALRASDRGNRREPTAGG